MIRVPIRKLWLGISLALVAVAATAGGKWHFLPPLAQQACALASVVLALCAFALLARSRDSAGLAQDGMRGVARGLAAPIRRPIDVWTPLLPLIRYLLMLCCALIVLGWSAVFVEYAILRRLLAGP